MRFAYRYYGESTDQPFFDLAARRHMLPSIMDGPLDEADQCRCPGGPDSDNWCIDSRPDRDTRLCPVCAAYCYTTAEDGTQILFVDRFGSVLEQSSEVGSVPDDTASETGQ